MPPTFLIFIAGMVYIPLFALILVVAIVMGFTENYKKYSASILAVYFMLPASIALAALATIPIFALCLGSFYVAENYLSPESIYPISIAGVSLVILFFFGASYKSATKLCPLAWRWAIQKWPNGVLSNVSNK